ncbi:Pycsar system effector family protein [Paracoccus aerius]
MALAVLLTLFSALGVVLPRKLAKGTSLFWGAWPEQGHRMLSAREKADTSFLFDEYARNVENLATLAKRKFRLVGIAFRGLMIWLACYVLLLATAPAS